MPFVSGKCPNCGAELQVDSSMESGFCQYCGTQIIIREAVQRYQVSVEGNVNVANLANENSLLDYAASIMEVNSQEAEQKIKAVLEMNPKSYRGWKELIRQYHLLQRMETKRLQRDSTNPDDQYMHKTRQFGVYIVCLDRSEHFVGWLKPLEIVYRRDLFRYDITVNLINAYKQQLKNSPDAYKKDSQNEYDINVVQAGNDAASFFNSFLKQGDYDRWVKLLKKSKQRAEMDFFELAKQRYAPNDSNGFHWRNSF